MTTARWSCSRARRAQSSSSTPSWRRRSRASRARSPSACAGPYADFEDGVRKQATLPEGALVIGARRHGARARAPGRRAAVAVVLPGPAARAAAALAARRSSPRRCGGPRARARARAARAALLRRQRVDGRAGAGRGRGRGRRAARRRSARATSRSTSTSLAEADGARARGRRSPRRCGSGSGSTCSPRTSGRSRSSCSTLCRERGLTLADGRVVHRRARRGAADVGRGLERRLPRRRSSPTRTRSRAPSWACRRSCSRATAPSRPRSPRRWPTGVRARLGADVGGRGDRRRRPGRRHGGEARRARLPARGGPGRRAAAWSSTCPATATRCAAARRPRRSTCCAALGTESCTKTREPGC